MRTMADKDMLVLHDCANSQEDVPGSCTDTCPTSSHDADQSINIKGDVSDVKEEEGDPVPISFPGIEAKHEVSCFISFLTDSWASAAAEAPPLIISGLTVDLRALPSKDCRRNRFFLAFVLCKAFLFIVRWNKDIHVKFEVFTAFTMKNVLFFDLALYRSCANRRFRGMYPFHRLS
jgi:hypothetical protein